MDGHIMRDMKDILLQRWQELANFSQTRETKVDSTIDAPQVEIIDIAQSLEQSGRDATLAEQERKEMVAVERALAKMATGSYGVCEDCGEDIPSRRLVVLPEARLCTHCQVYEERQLSRMRQTGSMAR